MRIPQETQTAMKMTADNTPGQVNIPDVCTGVCFTGHRDMTSDDIAAADHRLDRLLRDLIEKNGARRFFAGGAIGMDTLCALKVLALREEYPHIALDLLIPCIGYEKYMSDEEKKIYYETVGRADRVMHFGDHYYRGCPLVRDRALVDNADLCIAWLNPDLPDGGTAYTVKYARKKQVPVINIFRQENS